MTLHKTFLLSLSLFALSAIHGMDNHNLRDLKEEFVASIVDMKNPSLSRKTRINAAMYAVSEGAELRLRKRVTEIHGEELTNDKETLRKRFPRVFKKTSSRIVVTAQTERAKEVLIALLEAPTQFREI